MALKSIRIGAFWLRKDSNDKAYFSGSYDLPFPIIIDGSMSLMVFKNDRKEKDTHPDYFLHVAKKEDQGSNGKPKPAAGMAF